MKNSRKCPKCGGSDIIFVPGSAGAYGTGNNIMTGHTIMSAVPVDRYICSRCGFSEEWIDLDDMDKLKRLYNICWGVKHQQIFLCKKIALIRI